MKPLRLIVNEAKLTQTGGEAEASSSPQHYDVGVEMRASGRVAKVSVMVTSMSMMVATVSEIVTRVSEMFAG